MHVEVPKPVTLTHSLHALPVSEAPSFSRDSFKAPGSMDFASASIDSQGQRNLHEAGEKPPKGLTTPSLAIWAIRSVVMTVS